MQSELVQIFCEEYTKHLSILQKDKNTAQKRYHSELNKLSKERHNLVQAIKDGIPASMVKGDLVNLTSRVEELERVMAAHKDSNEPLLHPCMAARYRESVENLRNSLNKDGSRGEAAEHLRALIEKIVLTPRDGELAIDLYGDLAGILNIAKESVDMTTPLKLKKLQLLPANDNKSQALIDRIGSGDRI